MGKKPESSKKPGASDINLLQVGMQFGLILAIPLLVFILGGIWLDQRLGTTPLFILMGLGSGIFVSGIGLYVRIRDIFFSLGISSPKKKG